MITRETKSTLQSCYIFNLMVHLLNSCASQLQLIMRQKVMSCSCIWVQGSWSWVPGPGYSFQTMSTESMSCSCTLVQVASPGSWALDFGSWGSDPGFWIPSPGFKRIPRSGSQVLGPHLDYASARVRLSMEMFFQKELFS